jgi:predicted house-cleaning NTP pyrophosphatase (Maf/HAM1 superfamily)
MPFCVSRAGNALVVHRDHADVRMRALDAGEISRYLSGVVRRHIADLGVPTFEPGEISRYLERAGPGVLASVGAYQMKSARLCEDEPIRERR